MPMSRYSRDRKKQLFLQDTRIFFNVIGQLVLARHEDQICPLAL